MYNACENFVLLILYYKIPETWAISEHGRGNKATLTGNSQGFLDEAK